MPLKTKRKKLKSKEVHSKIEKQIRDLSKRGEDLEEDVFYED